MRNYRQVRPNLIPFVDYHTNILLIFILILAFSSITKKKSDESLSANVIYQIIMDWPGESAIDMDLWVKDSLGNVVGFSRREGGEGSLMSLAHDDLGSRNDTNKKDAKIVPVNQEIVSIRGTYEGEYIVNVHDYFNPAAEKLTKVTCKLVKIKPFKEIIKQELELTKGGQEETFFRFVFDKEGNVIETNHLPQKIVMLENEEEGNNNEQ